MYIIYLYLLSGFSKNLPQTGRRMYVTTLLLLVTCYLLPLIVKIAPAQAASSGRADMWNDLIVTCYLLLVTLNC